MPTNYDQCPSCKNKGLDPSADFCNCGKLAPLGAFAQIFPNASPSLDCKNPKLNQKCDMVFVPSDSEVFNKEGFLNVRFACPACGRKNPTHSDNEFYSPLEHHAVWLCPVTVWLLPMLTGFSLGRFHVAFWVALYGVIAVLLRPVTNRAPERKTLQKCLPALIPVAMVATPAICVLAGSEVRQLLPSMVMALCMPFHIYLLMQLERRWPRVALSLLKVRATIPILLFGKNLGIAAGKGVKAVRTYATPYWALWAFVIGVVTASGFTSAATDRLSFKRCLVRARRNFRIFALYTPSAASEVYDELRYNNPAPNFFVFYAGMFIMLFQSFFENDCKYIDETLRWNKGGRIETAF